MTTDDRRRKLLERLMATFQAEAEDHVRSLCECLTVLESAPDGDPAPEVVETAFRDCHSLKGAARSVGLLEIEQICGEMENLLSSLRHGRIRFSVALLPVLQRGVDAVAARLPGAENATAPEPAHDLVNELAAVLRNAEAVAPAQTPAGESRPRENRVPAAKPARAEMPAPPEQPVAPPPCATSTSTASAAGGSASLGVSDTAGGAGLPGPAGAAAPATGRSTTGNAAPVRRSEVVRASAEKLDALLQQGEELLTQAMVAEHLVAKFERVQQAVNETLREGERLAPELRRLRMAEARGDQESASGDSARRVLEHFDWLRERLRDIGRTATEQLRASEQHHRDLRNLVDEHLFAIRRTRVLPFSRILEGFPRMVREISRDLGIEVQLRITGADSEADRAMLDALRDPLTHLLRNALDHGIESPQERRAAGKPAHAELSISVSQAPGRRIELMLGDDGRGIEPDRVVAAAVRSGAVSAEEAAAMSRDDALDLIFRSSVSTARIVTDLSGRGLGLAIVRDRLTALGGTVTVQSTPGVGTLFRCVLPSSLATFHAIGVRVGRQLFGIPARQVEFTGRVHRSEIGSVENRPVIEFRGRSVGMSSLADVLELDEPLQESEWVPFFVAGTADRRVAFAVDRVVGNQDLLSKSLGPQLSRVRNVAGAAILGSGTVVTILSTADLLESAIRVQPRAASGDPALRREVERQRVVLLVEDSVTSRLLLKTVLEGAGHRVVTAVDGLEGLAALREQKFDLVVSDVEMPRMNGFSLCTRIRQEPRFADLPVVLVTTLESRRDRELGLEVGANAYIAKSSFDQDSLLDVIERLL